MSGCTFLTSQEVRVFPPRVSAPRQRRQGGNLQEKVCFQRKAFEYPSGISWNTQARKRWRWPCAERVGVGAAGVWRVPRRPRDTLAPGVPLAVPSRNRPLAGRKPLISLFSWPLCFPPGSVLLSCGELQLKRTMPSSSPRQPVGILNGAPQAAQAPGRSAMGKLLAALPQSESGSSCCPGRGTIPAGSAAGLFSHSHSHGVKSHGIFFRKASFFLSLLHPSRASCRPFTSTETPT